MSCLLVSWWAATTFGQAAPIAKQLRDGQPAQQLTAAELAELADPFFVLVLKDHSELTSLLEIENHLQPDASKRQVFAVHEDIVDPRPGRSGRRAVVAFTGSKDELILDTNVMLSVFFDSDEFSDRPFAIEAWGWDGHRGRYNYYKMDDTGTPDQRMSWKFRGSSVGADQLNVNDRRNTCLACHVNGGPVMKELLFPWNNWHSDVSKSPASYLKVGSPGAWKVANNPRLRGLQDAFKLEESMLASIQQFNRRRINNALRRREVDGNIETNPDGTQTVVEGRRLLRSLFDTTEYNIISAKQRSGLHALPELDQAGPSTNIAIPASFFLNAELISGGGLAPGYLGLGIAEAKSFTGVPFEIRPDEYKKLVQNLGLMLHGRLSDANFAWLTPEPSHIDNVMVDQLMKLGIASPQFVAATVLVDLENPLLSGPRRSLLKFVPNEFGFRPLLPDQNHLQDFVHPDLLTLKTIEAIRAANAVSGSTEAQWLSLLEDQDPVQRLREGIITYRDKMKNKLGDASSREAELKRMLAILVDRRKAVNSDRVLGNLDETGGRRLFPLPPG